MKELKFRTLIFSIRIEIKRSRLVFTCSKIWINYKTSYSSFNFACKFLRRYRNNKFFAKHIIYDKKFNIISRHFSDFEDICDTREALVIRWRYFFDHYRMRTLELRIICKYRRILDLLSRIPFNNVYHSILSQWKMLHVIINRFKL